MLSVLKNQFKNKNVYFYLKIIDQINKHLKHTCHQKHQLSHTYKHSVGAVMFTFIVILDNNKSALTIVVAITIHLIGVYN